MASYLLTCDCGQTLPVEVGQAGGQVVCACGNKLDVPTLRVLRHLPLVPTDPPKQVAKWSTRKGVTTAFLILAGLLVAFALWSRLTEPTLPTFDPAAHARGIGQEIDRWSPTQGWQMWIALYRPIAEKGFTVMQFQREPEFRAQIARQRFMQAVLLSVAGVFVALAALTALWPTAKNSGR